MAKAKIAGLNEFLRDMRTAPRELQNELRGRAQAIAEPIAEEARRNARTPQERLVAPSIRAVRDRLPVIKAGGGKVLASRTPRRRQPRAGDVYFGADFGASKLSQFPRKSKTGRLVFKAVKGNRKQIAKQYLDAVEKVFKGRI